MNSSHDHGNCELCSYLEMFKDARPSTAEERKAFDKTAGKLIKAHGEPSCCTTASGWCLTHGLKHAKRKEDRNTVYERLRTVTPTVEVTYDARNREIGRKETIMVRAEDLRSLLDAVRSLQAMCNDENAPNYCAGQFVPKSEIRTILRSLGVPNE